MIRRLQRKDYDQLELLIKEFYMDYNPKFLKGIQSEFEEYVDMDNEVTKMTTKYIGFKSSQKAIFVDAEGDTLRGYIYCYVYSDAKKPIKVVGFVEEWFVSKKYRGMNIGKQLWDRAMTFFKPKQIQAIELEVYSQNKNSSELYKKLGFKDLFTVMVKRV